MDDGARDETIVCDYRTPWLLVAAAIAMGIAVWIPSSGLFPTTGAWLCGVGLFASFSLILIWKNLSYRLTRDTFTIRNALGQEQSFPRDTLRATVSPGYKGTSILTISTQDREVTSIFGRARKFTLLWKALGATYTGSPLDR